MNADDDRTRELEQRTHGLLEESVLRVDARVRSRLNQARHAALEEIAARPRSFWRGPALMPATGALAAAAVVVLMLSIHRGPEHGVPGSEGGQTAYEDIELLADTEGLDLIEGWDGSFYEWAAAQTEDSDGASG